MQKFSLCEQIVLDALSVSLNPDKQIKVDSELFNQADWDTVGLISSQHAVAPLVFDTILKYKDNIPKAIFAKWYKHILKTLSDNSKVQDSQNELAQMMGTKDYVILKGLSSASYYPKPELRCLGDVDFLVKSEDFIESKNVLTDNGFEEKIETACHICYTKDGKILEMHFEIPGIPEGNQGEKVRNFIKPIFDTHSLKNGFNAPADMYHGVILLLHSAHHLINEGLGLRHLCDWACFVNSTANENFWDELLPFLKEIGMFKFAKVLTKICSNYLKTTSPHWASDVDSAVCYELMRDILTGGNFGRLDKTRSGSGMMMADIKSGSTESGKIRSLLKTLHSTMHSAYPILNKAPILYPFIFIYRIIKYLCLMILGRRPSLTAASKKADERVSIYNKLGMFKVD